MKSENNKPSQGQFGVNDVLYIVFKHKWKILLCSLIGFTAAGLMYLNHIRTPEYESSAQLMVRYVIDRIAEDPEEGGSMYNGGMSTQIALLRSVDTAEEVAEKYGPGKLMPEASKSPTAVQAASVILNGLEAESPSSGRRQSNLLNISFRNADPTVAVEVLDQVIKTYFEKHLELHRSSKAFESVQKQTDLARSALRQTEDEINRLKSKSGVLTIEGTMKEFEERRRGIRESKIEIQSMLAEQQAKVKALEASYKAAEVENANPLIAAEDSDEDSEMSPKERAEQRKRSLAIFEYRNLGKRLNLLQDERNKLLIEKKEGHSMVRSLDRQIDEVRSRGLDLVEEYPELGGMLANERQAPVTSLEDEKVIASSLEAKLADVNLREGALEAEVAEISELGFQLHGLERKRQMEEENYLLLSRSLDKAKVDETLDPAKIPNISIIQNPSPPVKYTDDKVIKLIAGVAGSGLALGLGLAFLLEMVIHRRVSRPTEIQTRLQLPLMMSIPYVRSRDKVAKLIGREPGLELLGDAGDVVLPPVPTFDGAIAMDDDSPHFITPYAASIRDRIMFNFELNNITHKPKLVALTGLSQGAGTSTIAAGIAKSFAENGKRKVLLVDLNPPSTNGKRLASSPADSLVKAIRVSQSERFRTSSRNLYFASAPTRHEGSEQNLLAPSALYELMPHLNASDFDYIIFDMPPVSPTSPTLSIAGFMDKVLLVLDGENTSQDGLRWGYAELQRSRADVSCVFNKMRNHAPQWVQGAA